jgi:hypothetical protein
VNAFIAPLAGLVLSLALLTASGRALAQPPQQSRMGTGTGSPPKQSAPTPDPRAPETHAASGASDTPLGSGVEPSLPEQPLEIPEALRKTLGSDLELDSLELGRGSTTSRDFYGLYYGEQSGGYQLRVAFPLWLERRQPSLTAQAEPDRASVFGGIYYNRRSAERADDVLFPLVWNLRDKLEGSRTTVVGPFAQRTTPTESDFWLAPLYFSGTRKAGGYTLIPPLLSYTSNDAEGGFNLVGPLFCSWQGGRSCDTRSAQSIDLGVAPFYFYGHDEQSQYELIPPLLHYYGYNDRTGDYTNVWGPYYRRHREDRDFFHLLPFYYSITGKDERHTTVLPFFHYGTKGDSSLLATPLFVVSRGDKGERLFASPLYTRYRGRTELDMLTPFYWHYRDKDAFFDQKLLFPFFLSRQGPRESTTVLFPFFGQSERFGISKRTWITPFFEHETSLRGWSTSVHPLLYFGRNGNDTHLVVAPFFWDFASPESRATVAFPLYWRFADRTSVSQLIGNVYYTEKQTSAGSDWEVHVFPAFSYGQRPDGHFWSVLYGLAGYTREGRSTRMRTLWIPFQLSSADE